MALRPRPERCGHLSTSNMGRRGTIDVVMSRPPLHSTPLGPISPIPDGELTVSNDVTLILALINENVDALAEIQCRHRPAMVAAAARILTRDCRAAEDVAQDVLLALWLHPMRFDPHRGSL